jgi:hypothetical protein
MVYNNALNIHVTGVITASGSGTFLGSPTTQYCVLVGSSNNQINCLVTGSAGQVLQSGGNSANPAYSTATYPSTAGTSGNVVTSNGTNFISQAPAANTINTTYLSGSGTWTINPLTVWVQAYLWGGGGGGQAPTPPTAQLPQNRSPFPLPMSGGGASAGASFGLGVSIVRDMWRKYF